jgi:hypothetical protein
MSRRSLDVGAGQEPGHHRRHGCAGHLAEKAWAKKIDPYRDWVNEIKKEVSGGILPFLQVLSINWISWAA